MHAEAPRQGPPLWLHAWLSRQAIYFAALNAWLPCLQYLENMRGPQARAAVERVEREIAASQAAVVEAAQVRRHAPLLVTCLLYVVDVQSQREASKMRMHYMTRAPGANQQDIASYTCCNMGFAEVDAHRQSRCLQSVAVFAKGLTVFSDINCSGS